MKQERLSGFCAWSTVTIFSLLALQTVQAAVKERAYTFDDVGAVAGGQPPLLAGFNRLGTQDTALSTTDYGGVDPPANVNNSFVPLIGSGNATRVPTFASAADRPGAAAGNLALSFDGVDDSLYNPTPPTAATVPYLFDPRDFGQFDALSQAWVKPTSAAFSARQFVWRIGRENGGLAITADGKWALRTGNPSAEVLLEQVEVASNVSVVPNQWTHVAVFRGGNFSFLYVDGSIAAMDPGFWGDAIDDVRLGANNQAQANPDLEPAFFKGLVDNFSIGTLSNGVFDLTVDLDYFADVGQTFSNVDGDVDQDGVVDQDDYDIWADNVGTFDNGFGVGDPTSLLLGDVNQSGRVDLVDFQIINDAALNPPPPPVGAGGGVPEASSLALLAAGLVSIGLRRARRRRFGIGRSLAFVLVAAAMTLAGSGTATAAVVVADDFLYDGPTKLLHVGGGFNGYQQYFGGQNGPAGNWVGDWDQIGDGIITTPDYTPPIDPFNGLPEPVAPAHVALYDGFFGVQSELFRDFQLAGSVSPTQTLYFGGRFQADLDIGTDGHTVTQYYAPRLFLNRVAGDDRFVDINNVPVDPQRDRTQDIALGFESLKNINTTLIENTVVARLGTGPETKAVVTGAPPNDGNWHTVVGKLEINVAGGANERLTVWIDPTGVETGGTSVQVETDVLTDLTGFIGTFHSQGTRPLNTASDPQFPIDPADSVVENPIELGRSYIDDMAIGTAWQDVSQVDVPRLTLRINRADNSAKLINSTAASFQLNGYSVESAAGSLNGAGWNSLDDQNVGNWQQNLATSNQLVESNFLGSTTIGPNGQLSLGSLFTAAATEDLTGRFTTLDGLVNLLEVEFVTVAGVAGDYNNDGFVNAADYTVWRDHLNQTFQLQNEGGISPGVVNAADYTFWKSRFGMGPGAGGGSVQSSAVPEPTTWMLAAIAMVAVGISRHAKQLAA